MVGSISVLPSSSFVFSYSIMVECVSTSSVCLSDVNVNLNESGAGSGYILFLLWLPSVRCVFVPKTKKEETRHILVPCLNLPQWSVLLCFTYFYSYFDLLTDSHFEIAGEELVRDILFQFSRLFPGPLIPESGSKGRVLHRVNPGRYTDYP